MDQDRDQDQDQERRPNKDEDKGGASGTTATTMETMVEGPLPLELLEAVFKRTDANTFLRIINASIAWNDLMKNEKVEALLPKVFPFVLPYLDGKDIMNLRKVSNTFKVNMDFFLQVGPIHRISNEGRDFMLIRRIPLSVYATFQMTIMRFHKYGDIELFMKEVGSTSADYNPFPGRAIHFAPVTANVTSENLRKFEVLAKEMIVKYGKHVWRFIYKMPLFCTNKWLFQHMATLLKNLPNLRCLVLIEGVHWLWKGLGDEEVVQGKKEKDPKDPEGLKGITFPPLPKLVELRIPTKESVFHGKLSARIRYLYGGGVVMLTLVPPPPQVIEEADFEVE